MRRRVTPAFHDVQAFETSTGGWQFRIGRALTSPNRNPAAHWSQHHAERQAWDECLRAGLIVAARRMPSDHWPVRQKRRMRLTVIRETPKLANFIRDRDNLVFATKRLRDALKGLRLVYDDSMLWLEQPDPVQKVSDDGKYWTVLNLEPVA